MKTTANRSLRNALILSALVSASCTWVKSTPEGRQVRVITPVEASACERLGSTTSKAMNKVLFVERNAQKLALELELLARNEAAEMGGNAVVADGPVSEEGRRRYTIYKCE